MTPKARGAARRAGPVTTSTLALEQMDGACSVKPANTTWQRESQHPRISTRATPIHVIFVTERNVHPANTWHRAAAQPVSPFVKIYQTVAQEITGKMASSLPNVFRVDPAHNTVKDTSAKVAEAKARARA